MKMKRNEDENEIPMGSMSHKSTCVFLRNALRNKMPVIHERQSSKHDYRNQLLGSLKTFPFFGFVGHYCECYLKARTDVESAYVIGLMCKCSNKTIQMLQFV